MLRLALVLVFVACGPGSKGGPTMNNRMNAPEPVAQGSDVVSGDILAREPVANVAQVKHILIGWQGKEGGDPRAQKRTKAEAEAQVRSVMGQIKAGGDFDALMKQYSEDPGSASTGRAYRVSPDAVGVIESDFGFHIMKRVE